LILNPNRNAEGAIEDRLNDEEDDEDEGDGEEDDEEADGDEDEGAGEEDDQEPEPEPEQTLEAFLQALEGFNQTSVNDALVILNGQDIHNMASLQKSYTEAGHATMCNMLISLNIIMPVATSICHQLMSFKRDREACESAAPVPKRARTAQPDGGVVKKENKKNKKEKKKKKEKKT